MLELRKGLDHEFQISNHKFLVKDVLNHLASLEMGDKQCPSEHDTFQTGMREINSSNI